MHAKSRRGLAGGTCITAALYGPLVVALSYLWWIRMGKLRLYLKSRACACVNLSLCVSLPVHRTCNRDTSRRLVVIIVAFLLLPPSITCDVALLSSRPEGFELCTLTPALTMLLISYGRFAACIAVRTRPLNRWVIKMLHYP